MNIVDKPLTDLQKKFARYYVEAKNMGIKVYQILNALSKQVILLIVHIRELMNY